MPNAAYRAKKGEIWKCRFPVEAEWNQMVDLQVVSGITTALCGESDKLALALSPFPHFAFDSLREVSTRF